MVVITLLSSNSIYEDATHRGIGDAYGSAIVIAMGSMFVGLLILLFAIVGTIYSFVRAKKNWKYIVMSLTIPAIILIFYGLSVLVSFTVSNTDESRNSQKGIELCIYSVIPIAYEGNYNIRDYYKGDDSIFIQDITEKANRINFSLNQLQTEAKANDSEKICTTGVRYTEDELSIISDLSDRFKEIQKDKKDLTHLIITTQP